MCLSSPSTPPAPTPPPALPEAPRMPEVPTQAGGPNVDARRRAAAMGGSPTSTILTGARGVSAAVQAQTQTGAKTLLGQ